MRKLRILTGQNDAHYPYSHYYWPARTFRKLGHTVDETGVYRGGYDFAFMQENQWREPRPNGVKYPVGYWSCDSDAYWELDRRAASNYECMFIATYDRVEQYREFSRKAVYLPFACDPEVHKVASIQESFDVGYIGRGGDEYRNRLLHALRQSGLKVRIYFNRNVLNPKKSNPFLSWDQLCRFYSQCKMIFNYGNLMGLTLRVFEGMSMGKLVLTNRNRSEPDNIFEDGKHLVVYERAGDLVEKAKYYASHPTEREAIAKEGQRLVHEKHKWTDRMNFVIETLMR